MITETQTIREFIHRENEYTNHRMRWFLTLQGFLFAALAFAWQEGVALSIVLSVLGILSSIKEAVGSERVISRGYKGTCFLMHWLLPWHFLPVLFVLSWVAVIAIRAAKLA